MKILPQKIRTAIKETPIDLSTRGGRTRALAGLYLADHGILRVFWRNLHAVGDRLYRSNQPSPSHIAASARAGVKTIINLRGPSNTGFHMLEREACAAHGISLENFRIYSRAAPEKATLRAARDLFARVDYPALMHCKSGADRVGFMSVLYLLIHEGRPLDEAMDHLGLRYLHLRQGKTGVLDHFFDAYRQYASETPIAFFDWVEDVYDADQVQASFRAQWWGELLVDGIFRRE